MLGKRTVSEREPHSESKNDQNGGLTEREDGEISPEDCKVSNIQPLTETFHFTRVDVRLRVEPKR